TVRIDYSIVEILIFYVERSIGSNPAYCVRDNNKGYFGCMVFLPLYSEILDYIYELKVDPNLNFSL
ncbi:hypothetical protein L9F63_003876, partial [Diploptera punctata]